MSFATLNDYIQQELKTGGVAGVSLAITHRDKTLYSATYGTANRDAQTPVMPDTLFEIGSIGKSFTSIIVQQLVNEGKIDLHTPITEYLDWFDVQSQYEPITLHHLLSHTAGIINGTDFPGDSHYEAYALRETPTGSPPGTYFHYSNVGYKTIGVLLETVLQQTYHDMVTERILKPLGMTKTSATISNANRPQMAVDYSAYYDDRPHSPKKLLAPATWLETATADGCILSTAEDMAIYLRMLLNKGQINVLSQAGFERIVEPVIKVTEDSDIAYGYGLAIRRNDEIYEIEHTGGMVGYIAYMVGDMNSGVGVTLLVNSNLWGGMMRVGKFALQVAQALANNQSQPETPTIPDLYKIENTADYVGVYGSDTGEFTIQAQDEQLTLVYKSETIALQGRGDNRFYVNHPDFELFLLEFGRDADENVVEALHGEAWFRNDKYTGATSFDYPKIWNTYRGHYRCNNPWDSNGRIIVQKGQLKLATPSGFTQPLTPLEADIFRAGEDEQSPERVRFDTIINGQALRLHYSTQTYYRFFTP